MQIGIICTNIKRILHIPPIFIPVITLNKGTDTIFGNVAPLPKQSCP